MKIRRSFVQRDLPCKRTGNFNERLTDAEIMRAIHYLNRDVCPERASHRGHSEGACRWRGVASRTGAAL